MSKCQCSMAISMTGDGCRYCQPQTYIDKLSEIIDDERSEHEEDLAATVKESLTAGKAQMARDSAELRRLCAERDQLKAKCVALEDYAAAVEKSAEKLEAELAALKAKAHDVASVPDGYGPTHKMVLAGERQWELSGNESPDCAAIYRAMIAAAPAQPQSDCVMVPRELLLELRDSANEAGNLSFRQHHIDHHKRLARRADSLLGGEA